MLTLLALCSLTIDQTGSEYTLEATSIQGESIMVGANGGTKPTVVCFLGTECPMARLYGPRLTRLAAELRSISVNFIGVMSNRQDSVDDIKTYAAQLKIGFPLIHDRRNVIADQYDARRTPEVFLLDEELRLVYRGAIDDQYAPGIARTKPTHEYLRIAIDELLAGKPITLASTDATGCLIGRVSRPRPNPRGITYTKQVSRVLAKHCVECHRAGEIGPFALEDYDEIVGWGDMMVEVIDNGRMPPWHADPRFGHYANARLMPEEDKQIIRDWVLAGSPRGEDADLPEPTTYTDGWQLPRKPDHIAKMPRPFRVPADGVVEYQYFVVDPGFTEDKWITGAQIIPGHQGVVHHAIAFVRPPDGERFRGLGWLAAYVPGQRVIPMPDGHGRRVPAGSKLVFQMHYTPNGTWAEDQTQIGLLFGKESDISDEVYTLVGINQDFVIPPNADNYKVHAEVPWLPENGQLLAITPHMHYRGKSFQLFNGKNNQPLLHVPAYDFNWQHTYELAKPMPLQETRKLRFDVTFDNSPQNPFNPDPAEWVTWGDQTWEEMVVAFFEVSEPRKGTVTAVQAKPTPEAQEKRQRKIARYIARVLKNLDTNGDGVIHRAETPIVMRHFNFGLVDENGDQKVTRKELRRVAEKIY